MGPRAISLDFEIPDLVEFAGIPERTTVDGTINLPDTLKFNLNGEKLSLKDPYRLFNLDVFEYEANTTQLGLYGSIPYLTTFSDTNKGNVGIYWANSAETWVDLYTAEYIDP
jgi:alpha 1,3-glucosidase